MSLKIDRVQLDIVINGDQSRIKLRELEDQAAKLKRELKKLPEGTEEYIKKSAELRKVQAEMDGIINKIGVLGLTYKELAARQRELNTIMRNLDPRTPQYRELDEQLQRVNARMRELRGGAQETGFSFGKMADGFNRYFGVITAFAASFTGVVLGIRQMVDKFNEFEAKVDELSALTGLAGEDLDWLAEQAKKLGVSTTESGINITKGATEIVDAYKLMGSAKPELLGNKEALNEVTTQALILAEAAKMETAPAVTALANIMNQFGAPDSDAAKYINVLAAGAKEGAAEIPDLSDSIVKFGAAAMQANLSVEESVALVEALAEKGFKGEIAGTGIRNVLLELQKGADDTNPKIVGINKALENLAAKNLSAAEMMKMFGKENYTAAQLLLTNRERVEELTKAVTDTNVATEQAVKNTNNNAAALAQAKNAAALTAMEFGQKLAPAMTFSTNGVTMFLKAMMAVIQFVATHIKTIATITAGIIAYTVAVNAQVIAQKAYTLATQIAEKVTKIFNATAKSGPWGWIAAAIAAAVTALAMFAKRTTDAAAAQKVLNEVQTEAKKAIAGEKTEIERLLSIAQDEKRSKEDRIAAIKKLNEISPKYLGNLNLENINTEAAKKATEEYIKVLEKKALVQAAQEKLVELEKQFIDLREQGTGAEIKWYQTLWNSIKAGGNAAAMAANDAMTSVNNYNAAFEELTVKKKALLGILSDSPIDLGTGSINTINGDSGSAQIAAKENTNQILADLDKEQREQALANARKYERDATKIAQDLTDSVSAELQKQIKNDAEASQEKLDKFRETEEEEKQEILLRAKQWVSELRNAGLSEELVRLDQERIAFEELYKQKLITAEEYERAIAGIQIQKTAEKVTITTDYATQGLNLLKGIYDADSQALQIKYDKEYKSLEDQHNRGLLSDTVYNEKKKALQEKQEKEEKRIKKRQANVDFLIQIAQIVSSTAQAVAKSVAASPLTAGLPWSAINAAIGAAQAGVAIYQRAKVAQAFTGQYPVIGATDGKSYNVPYAGKMRTAIYPRPVLVSEHGGEMVVDAATTNDLVVNYPGIVSFIKGLSNRRVPQYADGNIPEVASGSGGSSIAEKQSNQVNIALVKAISELNSKLDNLQAYVVIDQFDKAKAENDARISDITRS